MMAPTPKTERSYDLIDILFIFWRAVMILLAAVIGVYGYWTAVAAESAKCAGMQWIAGYRAGVITLWVMPSLGILAAGWTVVFFRRAKITEVLRLAPYCETLFSFGAIRVSVGAV